MIIKKKETIEFSAEELRCFEMTMMLMKTISENATHPDLTRLAGCAAEDLCVIYTKFLEGVD